MGKAEKRVYGSAIRERLTEKSVWRWRKRKRELLPGYEMRPGGEAHEKGEVRDGGRGLAAAAGVALLQA
jgi:hypothetical protein